MLLTSSRSNTCSHISFLKESTFFEVGDIYLKKKTLCNHCFCKYCSHPHGRIHANTKEPLYSEFAIVPGCPSQLDLCTKTLYHSFFYLDSLNKRSFSKQTCLKLQRRQRLERLNVSSEATYSLCYCTPFSLNGGGHFPQQSGDIICT